MQQRSFTRSSLALLACLVPPTLAQAQVTITVSPSFPSDIAGGAPAATLQQAAAFAWQEFIALNWPALAGQRDTPDPSQKFGSGNGTPTIGETPGTGGTPLVWQTFRSKVEILNLTSSDVPPGYTPSGPSYGYNTPTPTYVYATREIAACQTASSTPAWINLDETTQIGLDQMFAGGPATGGG